jgi:hypothetical protein
VEGLEGRLVFIRRSGLRFPLANSLAFRRQQGLRQHDLQALLSVFVSRASFGVGGVVERVERELDLLV